MLARHRGSYTIKPSSHWTTSADARVSSLVGDAVAHFGKKGRDGKDAEIWRLKCTSVRSKTGRCPDDLHGDVLGIARLGCVP